MTDAKERGKNPRSMFSPFSVVSDSHIPSNSHLLITSSVYVVILQRRHGGSALRFPAEVPYLHANTHGVNLQGYTVSQVRRPPLEQRSEMERRTDTYTL